jgi:predicted Rossmann fold flavoprotein
VNDQPSLAHPSNFPSSSLKSNTNSALIGSKPIVIIGAGAAGLFAAAILADLGLGSKILVLEKTLKPAAKVLISGGGRCNVTHNCFDPRTLCSHYPRGQRELLGPFKRFNCEHMIEWLESKGIDLKTEEDGRVFPSSNRSQTIVDCLMTTATKGGVEIKLSSSVEELKQLDVNYLLQTNHENLFASHILIASGSHPSGLKLARLSGHNLLPPVASLFSFHVENFPFEALAGISLHASVWTSSKLAQHGPLLITHWGFSGPAILKLSAWQAIEFHQTGYKTPLWIDWLPTISLEGLEQHLLKAKSSTKSIVTVFDQILPKSLAKALLDLSEIDSSSSAQYCSDKKLKVLASKLKKWPFMMNGKSTHKQEFVTCGGIALDEINFKRFESKISPRLFFAGEILNIDAVTGGFNFQNAWTSSWHVAQAIADDFISNSEVLATSLER